MGWEFFRHTKASRSDCPMFVTVTIAVAFRHAKNLFEMQMQRRCGGWRHGTTTSLREKTTTDLHTI